MVLRSYGFMKEVAPEAWGVLADMPKDVDCTLEFIEAVLKGRIDFKSGVLRNAFNWKAYNKKVSKLRKMAGYGDESRTLHIIGEAEEPEAYGISEADIPSANQKDVYEEVDDKDELDSAIRKLDSKYIQILVIGRIDIWICLKRALSGVPNSVRRLKEIAEYDPQVSRLLKIVLQNKSCAVSQQIEQRSIGCGR